MAAPLNTCTTIEQRGVVRFLWAKEMAAKDIHKEMVPMYVEHCLSLQAVHNWVREVLGWAEKYRRRTSSRSDYVPTATTIILCRRFPGTCETVGQVFKSVWSLCWKINVVCVSLSPFVSFQSHFVSYLLNFPHTIKFSRSIRHVEWTKDE